MVINQDTEINQEKKINQDTKAQHHSQYIEKQPLEENNYINKYINYTPT